VVSATAVLKPLDVRPIFSKISGQIVDLPVKAGDVVEEGQILLQLDQRDALIKLRQANAAVRLAEAGVGAAEANLRLARTGKNLAQKAIDATEGIEIGNVKRVELEGARDLADTKISAAEEAIAAAKSQVELAKSKVAEADYGLEVTTIRVPAGRNGQPKRKYVVLKREVEQGQNVDTKLPLFVLAADLGELEAHALIPESQITRVDVGQNAEFWVDALGDDKKLPAKVTEVRPAPSGSGIQGAVNFEVVLNVENVKNKKTGAWQLMSGMTAQVEITDRFHRDVWKLPVNARSFTLEENHLTAEAKKAVAEAEERLDMNKWSKIWILRNGKPWPVFVRLSGVGPDGETGIKDAEYHEILEWDAQTKPEGLNPKDPKTFPEVIIGVPPKKNGLFDFNTNIKL
ncbi:MAG TPA: HlyD family efflux transporter periplasmic adaptor subunit, partial [Gemmataceae bacterium]|nr:HlyD family efflux transporter periplasmic adaptor subunit [Gemmataceae bacterium]